MINLKEIDEDFYSDICKKADYYGVESLTKQEQVILLLYYLKEK